MKKIALALVALVCVVACSRSKPQPAPESTDTREHVDKVLVQATGDNGATADKATREGLLVELDGLMERLHKAENLAAAFRIVEKIEDLGQSVAPTLQERVPKLAPVPRIAGYRAIWTLGSLENDGWDTGVKGLLGMVTGEGEIAHRVAAAEVLGAVASTRHEAILRKALNEQVFEPEVRVQLAIALWRSNRDPAATKVLNDLLSSDNDSFRIMAALALGEINQLTADSTPILEKLADEPTMRGRAAKRALDFGRAMKRFDAAMAGNYPGQPKVEPIDVRLLDNLQRMIRERYIYPDAVSGKKLIYAAASGMLEGLDPYTCLLEDNQLRDAGEIRRFAVPTLGLMLGSARLQENRQIRLTRVLSVKPDSPADRAGLQPGDRIYRVVRGVTPAAVHKLRADSSGLGDEVVPFQELPLDEAITQFQGAVGTTIGMQTFRDGWLLSRWVHVTHEKPEFEAVSHEMLPGNIGMVHVVELNAASPPQVKAAVAELREKKAVALILDLRSCAGGSVEAATQVAGLFLANDTLVSYSMGRSAELAPKVEHRTSNAEADVATPLVVLVNGGTADAGEVLAGALREHQRARIAGQKTFGRAIVQELIPLSAKELDEDGRAAALLLTVARYHGPVSGVAWYDRGVEPDVTLTPRLFEGWIYDQFEQATEGALPAYLDTLFKDTELDKLKKLATGDARNPAAWPGLDELYTKLGLQFEKEDLRYLVRREVRARLIEQEAGINQADLQEDYMFTGAVKEAARLAKIDLTEIPEYAIISK
jgi:carboxyl-terminal processing protease